jgi:hypothetical protein
MKLNLKNIWLFFAVLVIAFVPLEICAVFFTMAFVESLAFLIALGVAIVAIMLFICFTKINIRNIDVKQNFGLGLLSLLIAGAFMWCMYAYFNDTSKYDFELQPFLMSVFSALSCVTFVLAAATFFSGRNILGKVSFFIFCPILWFALKMLLFLSIYNTSADVYEVALAALITFFLVYHTQVFSTSSDSNIVKLMFLFGTPAIILSLIKCVPVIIKFINNQTVSAVSISTCSLEALISIYILLVLIEAQRQLQKSHEPVIRSVTL